MFLRARCVYFLSLVCMIAHTVENLWLIEQCGVSSELCICIATLFQLESPRSLPLLEFTLH